MNTKIAAIIATACLSLAACSQNTQQTQAPQVATSSETAAPASVATQEASNSPQVLKYEGKVVGYAFDTYHFDGKKGQVVKITVTGKGHADAYLYGYDDFSSGVDFTLPETTQYEVRVGQPRNSARRGDTSTYNLTIELK